MGDHVIVDKVTSHKRPLTYRESKCTHLRGKDLSQPGHNQNERAGVQRERQGTIGTVVSRELVNQPSYLEMEWLWILIKTILSFWILILLKGGLWGVYQTPSLQWLAWTPWLLILHDFGPANLCVLMHFRLISVGFLEHFAEMVTCK